MQERKRLKLCPSCYGRVAFEVIVCPFCGRAFNEHILQGQQPYAQMPPYQQPQYSEHPPLYNNQPNHQYPYQQPQQTPLQQQSQQPQQQQHSLHPNDPSFLSMSPYEMNMSLYPPPYQPKAIDDTLQKEQVMQENNSFNNNEYEEEKILDSEDSENKEYQYEENNENTLEDDKEEIKKNVFWPLILFSIGLNLFIFSLIMFLFSSKGELILRWNAHLWIVYVLVSIPMLYFGMKGFNFFSLKNIYIKKD